jgi:signal transduction histidine kinase
LVQLRTERTALVLYGVLLVLPTLVLGGLQWLQIVHDKQDELEAVPRTANAAAGRFAEELVHRVEVLIQAEEERPFQHYGASFCPDDAGDDEIPLLPSPLVREARPPGVLCWFVADLVDEEALNVELYWGDARDEGAQREGEMRAAVGEVIRRHLDDELLRRAVRLGDYKQLELPLRSVAANRADIDDQECLLEQRQFLCQNRVELLTSQFYLQLYRGADDVPRIVATRRVLMGEAPYLAGMNECLHRLSRGLGLMQGFFIEGEWLFRHLPETVARSVLGESQHFVPMGAADCCEGRKEYHAEVRVVDDLGMDVGDGFEPNFGLMRVAVDTQEVEARFQRRARRFFGVAAMLALSLGTGMVLLLRSVGKDLEQAQRTENFVNAVTHELRTPLSAIKLHGEMLLDGWAKDEDKKQTYYRRIVRETERLSTMVERVLEKARLSAGAARPFAGDLSATIEELRPELTIWDEGERHDVAFELADDLPRVMLTREAVVSIVVNLVENARKYAPVDTSDENAQPIEVVAECDAKGRVQLEVRDRGPGISSEEAGHVFEAFYRVGNETTRTSRGTGLGLHLVALQAAAIGARAAVEPRAGGGTVFRITFEPAPRET